MKPSNFITLASLALLLIIGIGSLFLPPRSNRSSLSVPPLSPATFTVELKKFDLTKTFWVLPDKDRVYLFDSRFSVAAFTAGQAPRRSFVVAIADDQSESKWLTISDQKERFQAVPAEEIQLDLVVLQQKTLAQIRENWDQIFVFKGK